MQVVKSFLSKFYIREHNKIQGFRFALTIESKKNSSLINIALLGHSFWIVTPKLFSSVLYKDHGTWQEYLRRRYGVEFTSTECFLYYGIYNDEWHSKGWEWNSKMKLWNYPWKQSKRIRYDFLNPDGSLFCSVKDKSTGGLDFTAISKARETVPKIKFSFNDYDGELIEAITYLEETEWRHGTGIWKFIIPMFKKNDVYRCLDVAYESEVGRAKGSWKGGLVGHSIEMLPGETPLATFTRYGTMETSYVKHHGQVPNDYTNIQQL